MKKQWLLAAYLLIFALLLCGCAGSGNPLIEAEATDVPGLNMRLHPAEANDISADEITATLYFRYLDEPTLAPESRVLKVRRDETPEKAIVRALIEGPSAGRSELRRLFPENLTVESAVRRDDVLFLTFTGALMNTGDVPNNWQSDPVWAREAPLRRYLAIVSAVNSITESYAYSGVQVLVHDQTSTRTSLRLENSFFLNGKEGLSDPITRDESSILTPHNAAQALLTAWRDKDADRLDKYLCDSTDGTQKPSVAQILQTLSEGGALLSFDVSAGSVSMGGRRAVIAANLSLRGGDGIEMAYRGYPLRMLGDVWRMPYDEWERLIK